MLCMRVIIYLSSVLRIPYDTPHYEPDYSVLTCGLGAAGIGVRMWQDVAVLDIRTRSGHVINASVIIYSIV